MNHIRLEHRPDGITVFTFDAPDRSVNTISLEFLADFDAAMTELENREGLAGVIVTSAKETFFAGMDLAEMLQLQHGDPEVIIDLLTQFKRHLRRLEQLGHPVVAALNGSALGGGYEVSLACHHRIALNDPRIRFGLPEVTLGLLPGGGGVSRLPRMIGLQKSLMDYLLTGRRVRPDKALADGLIDEIVDSPEALLEAATAWITANPEPVVPWDQKGFRIPGGGPDSPKLAAILPSFPANLMARTHGSPMPAVHAVLAATIHGARVDIDTSLELETRHIMGLLTDRVSTNLVQSFFDLQHCRKGAGRPVQADGSAYAPWRPTKVAVIGAGMMGAGIAYVTAKAGIDVVLKDVDLAAAEKGKGYSQTLLEKAIAKGRSTPEKAQALLERITPTADNADLAGCDLVIEAVFESPELKHKVFGEIELIVAPDALLGSNTSALPITGLAEAVERRADFIGLHFFSPVDKMPLLEIIRGAETSDAAVARALDFAAAISMTPIVVADSRGFYTSRVFSRYVTEAAQMLAEGIDPAIIENAGRRAGYPAAPLQLLDELNLLTVQKIMVEATRTEDPAMRPTDGAMKVITAMVEAGRTGKQAGAGFYEYADGRRTRLWPGLRERFETKPTPGIGDPKIDLSELVDRFLFVQVLETQRCVDEGVITHDAEANIGAMMGFGFPTWTGGPRQFLASYPGGRGAFVARARELEQDHGVRFGVPSSLAP